MSTINNTNTTTDHNQSKDEIDTLDVKNPMAGKAPNPPRGWLKKQGNFF